MNQELVRRLFKYNEKTGVLTYKQKVNYRTIVGKEAGWLWVDGNKKYRHVKVKGKSFRVHRLIWLYVYGEFPEGQIDHIDGNGLNNKIENLRSVQNIVNAKNRSIQCNNTSGYNGINELPSGNWRVRINKDRKRINVGTFSSYKEAYAARKQAEIEYGYHANHGRVK